MTEPAPKQDIDSGTGEIITPGEPVDHVDLEGGQSVGHRIEPPAEPTPAEPSAEPIHEPGKTVSSKPDTVSLDDIYSKATKVRDGDTEAALADMDREERAHYHRMIAEAQGVTDPAQDPFDGDGKLKEGWVDTGAGPAQVVQPAEPIAPASPQTVTPVVDTKPEMTTIIVYGEKLEIPVADIEAAGGQANYQKVVAADERMKRASTYEASLRAYDNQLQERAAALQTSQATDTTAKPEPPTTGAQDDSVDVQAQAEKLVGAMYTGDREAAITQAAEVLASIQETARAAQTTAVQPGAQEPTLAEQKLANERADIARRDREEANHVFVDEFSDLKSPVLSKATYAMVQTVAAEPIMYGRPLAEITREAGMRVRADVFGENYKPPGEPAPTTPVVTDSVSLPTAQPTDLATRMALKSRTVVQPLIPAGGGRFTEPKVDSQKFESNSEYIARMKREQRGQHA